MKKAFFLLCAVMVVQVIDAQNISQKLAKAMKQLEADPQLRHAIASLFVVDAKTGKPVYAHNEQTGLAPASTQKLFTSVAAFELLGEEYRYKTEIQYVYPLSDSVLSGHFVVASAGDPTFGSFRFSTTKPEVILDKIVAAIKEKKIRNVSTTFRFKSDRSREPAIPGGWIYEDIGNYYGAGIHGFNWRENQYDIVLKSGKRVGDTVSVVKVDPPQLPADFDNNLETAAKGSGDNAYVYFDPASKTRSLYGTIPVEENSFIISASLPDPGNLFTQELFEKIIKDAARETNLFSPHVFSSEPDSGSTVKLIHLLTLYSPIFDSMNYWFLRKSINLYGEAFVHTIAREKTGLASHEKGIELVRDFWSRNGIEKPAIHIIDGSGLSPQNRVTTDAEVKVLQYAKTRSWYHSFYNALPEYNGMKMKSGSIGGSRAYAGYHTAKDGKEYIFSIIVNNYEGSSGEVVKKMYKVLDILKQ